jgi:hypothetical protein
MSFLQDDATLSSYRTLVACDPLWSAEYAREQWFEDDPWLRHAMHDGEPVRSSEIRLRSPREEVFAQAAARSGFASAVIAPAPSTHGTARIGMLALGSATPGFFEAEGYAIVRVLARALAMELHAWLARSILRELIDKARITPDDIALLRHEAAGHSSKVIAAAMNTEAKTIDCRFQRVSSKLGAPNRRAAVRLARLSISRWRNALGGWSSLMNCLSLTGIHPPRHHSRRGRSQDQAFGVQRLGVSELARVRRAVG